MIVILFLKLTYFSYVGGLMSFFVEFVRKLQ